MYVHIAGSGEIRQTRRRCIGKSVYGVATGRNYIYNAQLQIVNPHIGKHEVVLHGITKKQYFSETTR